MIALNSASSSANDVSIRHWISGCARPDLATHLDAVAVREPHVEHRDVRMGRRDAAECFFGRPGLADDLEIGLLLEQLAQTAANDLVVVEEEDAGRHDRHSAS